VSTSHVEWKRQVNTLRFLYRELELVEEMIEEATPAFLQYYRDFCKRHNITPENGPPGTEPTTEKPEEILGALAPTSGSMAAPREHFNDEFGNWHSKETPQPPEEAAAHKVFTKIFKKIAYHLHPDRAPPTLSAAEEERRLKMFKKTLDALENKQYFRLMIIAEKFDIETPELNEEQQKWLKHEITMARTSLGGLQGTYNYHFSQCKTDVQKEELMKSFISQNFGIQVQKNT